MLPSRFIRTSLSACILFAFLTTSVFSYFLIDDPQRETQWVNNQPHLISWRKGLLDGIDGFDIELARLNTDGLNLIAKNVLAQQRTLNVFLQGVPPGDDYFIIFMNSTHGVMHATSPRFTILASGSNPSSKPPAPDGSVPTVTVSGAPNPTKAFATTFPALPSKGSGRGMAPSVVELAIVVVMTVGCIVTGSTWTMS